MHEFLCWDYISSVIPHPNPPKNQNKLHNTFLTYKLKKKAWSNKYDINENSYMQI